MMGDILAWIFGAAAILVLAAAGRRRRDRRERYHEELIQAFADGEEELSAQPLRRDGRERPDAKTLIREEEGLSAQQPRRD